MERQASFGYDTDDDDEEDLFSLSPLSSPDSSPDNSPKRVLPALPPAPETPATPVDTSPHPLSGAANNKRKGRARRKRKREAEKAALTPCGYQPRPNTRRKYVLEAEGLKTELASEDTRIASTGYVGIRTPKSSSVYSLKQLVGPSSRFGFNLVEWDGR